MLKNSRVNDNLRAKWAEMGAIVAATYLPPYNDKSPTRIGLVSFGKIK